MYESDDGRDHPFFPKADPGRGDAEEREESLTLDSLLDGAVRYGITERDFWSMTLRQYARIVRVRSEMQQEAEKAAWTRAAVETAYMMNMVGGAAAGKKWKQVQPKDLLDQWLGDPKQPKRDFWTRWEKAQKLHRARIEREALKASAS